MIPSLIVVNLSGEILDLAEGAATPAIIEGCVKGIEKEGKAEFKAFGKKHTLSLGKLCQFWRNLTMLMVVNTQVNPASFRRHVPQRQAMILNQQVQNAINATEIVKEQQRLRNPSNPFVLNVSFTSWSR